VCFDKVKVVQEGLGVMRVALVHDQKDPPPRPTGTLDQLPHE
jgi:hypothetical protein